MRNARTATAWFLVCILTVCIVGWKEDVLDPTQIGRFRPVPAVNVILDSLGVAEETPSTWENAEEPKPIDVIQYETDYVFGPGDEIVVSIFELLLEGQLSQERYTVTETGKISIQEVGTVEVAGLTESEVEEEIKQILMPGILKEPLVYVTLLESQQRTFSILGTGIPRPSRYGIPRYDYRLLDALATAGGISQFNISYVYVTRAVTGKEAISEPVETEIAEPRQIEQLIIPEDEMLEIIAPRADRNWQRNRIIITSAEMVTDDELTKAALPNGFEPLADEEKIQIDRETEDQQLENIEWVFENGKWVQVRIEKPQEKLIVEDQRQDEHEQMAPDRKAKEIIDAQDARETIEAPIKQQQPERVEWIFQDGRWTPVRIGYTQITKKDLEEKPREIVGPLEERLPDTFEWDQIGTGGKQTRLIKIPTDKLLSGDPRYNIIIRPGDNINVPVDIIGEFCIMGNVNGQGFIGLTGRPMTLKMAIAAAGGLGPLAWPKRCEVTRRIGKKKEETVMVDLNKIARGEQPDFFIKPNDLINVGTHPTARWRAVLRNAFRATYGFGFIYDRNFADRDFGTSRPFSFF